MNNFKVASGSEESPIDSYCDSDNKDDDCALLVAVLNDDNGQEDDNIPNFIFEHTQN
jgi:hypothetical protein